MKRNIYWEGIDSYNGYQSGILHKLELQIPFSYCLLTNKQHDDEDRYDPARYELVNYDVCANCRYEEAYDLNDCIPLSAELLEALSPYEPMALKMLMRITEFDIFDFEEAKRLYIKHVRFWNHMLEERNINFVILTGVPHHTHDYVIHALAQIKRIPMCIMTPMSIPSRLFTGTSLDDIWKKTAQAYLEMPDGEVELPPDIERFYQAVQYKNTGTDDGLVHGGKFKKPHYKFHKHRMLSYVERRVVWHRLLSRIKHGVKLSLTEHDWSHFAEYRRRNKEDLRLVRMTRRKLRTMQTLKDYNKIAELPDYNSPFVVYMLHMQPEGSTLPQAGVFVEQYLAVQILAKALENTGIRLYVKEHYVQPYRSRDFYRTLQEIRGVHLIRSTVDSKELLRHCLASSTCTGTIIIESIINGKPALVFGSGGTEYAPGVFKVKNAEECSRALREIQSEDFHIDQRDVRRYLKAFADHSVYAYLDPRKAQDNPALSLEESEAHIADWAAECIREQETAGSGRKEG